MAGCRRKNDTFGGRPHAKTFSSDTVSYRYHPSSLTSLQQEREKERQREKSFERHERHSLPENDAKTDCFAASNDR